MGWRRALLAVGLTVVTATGETYRVDRREQWREWEFAVGTIEIRADGTVHPRRFEGPINAARDAPDFLHKTAAGAEVRGGVNLARSGTASAPLVIDGETGTWWQPDADSELQDWQLDVDLGRAVPATRVRLIFPDLPGARPFREFRVFGSNGVRQVSGKDIFSFHLIGGTVRPNHDTVVEYAIRPLVRSMSIQAGSADTGVPVSDTSFALLQYLRFRADAKSPDAALAEIEVTSFGENVSRQTLERGGTLVERLGRGTAMLDGDANTSWLGRSSPEEPQPTWVWDLGSLYWVDRVILFGVDGSQIYGSVAGVQDHRFHVSDGRRQLTGEPSYDVVNELDLDAGHPAQLTYLFSPPRPVRYLSSVYTTSQSGEITEVAVFPRGYLAEVQLTSGNIDLGQIAGDGRPKVIEAIGWDVDEPEGTSVQVQTRSGNTLEEITLYYHRNGKQITRDEYNKLVTALRGETLSVIRQGADWSNWSPPYRAAEEGGFRSPSPRRYMQARILLQSDRLTAAASLRSFWVRYSDALLGQVLGRVRPSSARPGQRETYTMTIRPDFAVGDRGFDQIRLAAPSRVPAEDLVVRVGGRQVSPDRVDTAGDTIVVQLSQTVRRDSVELEMNLVLTENPTVLQLSLSHSALPEVRQPVDPSERYATTVFLPEVAESRRLLGDVGVEPRILSPNGDGIGDDGRVRIQVHKVPAPPRVRVYGLDGQLVVELEAVEEGSGFLARWDGRDGSRRRVPPGIYVVLIEVDGQARSDSAIRLLPVAY